MKKLAIVSAICFSSIALSGAVSASGQVTYSTDEYCSLSSTYNQSGHKKRFLKAYANKLGAKPSDIFCKELRTEKFVTLPQTSRSWDYRFNKPYAGSVIRLSHKVVKQLKAKDELASR
ncbi:MAG: hypothetical protein ACJAS9_001081 [Polaribacter sp.]|jgi:hypothetical protein